MLTGETMVSPLFRFGRSGKSRPTPRGPAGKRCYVIGDVHGRLDLLEQLFDTIAAHDATRPRRDTSIVLLGDLIDRGPDSRGVIDLVRRGPPFPARLIALKGNHEDMLVRGLSGAPQGLANWLQVGGADCARSYGVAVGALIGQTPEAMAETLLQAIPSRDLAFLAALPDSARFGDYVLVHAGVRPGLTFEEQSPQDMRWIRKPFLESRQDFGFVVVHGHSVSPGVEERANRIGIDTGAYRTGLLTSLWIEDDQRGFLQVQGPEDTRFEPDEGDEAD